MFKTEIKTKIKITDNNLNEMNFKFMQLSVDFQRRFDDLYIDPSEGSNLHIEDGQFGFCIDFKKVRLSFDRLNNVEVTLTYYDDDLSEFNTIFNKLKDCMYILEMIDKED